MNIKSLIAGVLIGFFLLPCHAAYVGVHAAAATGNVEQLKKYLTDDPQLISARNGPNRTPLCIAVMCGQTEAVEFLISQGADVNDRGFQEMTPLADMAAYGTTNDQRCAEIAAMLLGHGATIDPVDVYKDTPLLHAMESRKSRLAQVLVEHGADQMSRYIGANSGLTALHMASRDGDKETVAVLLKFNPPLDVVNADAQSPLMLAEMLDRTEISGMIRRATGDTNSIPTRAEMRVLGKRIAEGEMSLEELAKVALELDRTVPPDINLRAYMPSPRGQLIRDRIGTAFVEIGDEAIKGNEKALQVLRHCLDPKNPLTGFTTTYSLEAFSRLAAAGNKEALDIVLQYDTQGTMNTFLYAPAAANVEPAVDYFVSWLSSVKPYEGEGGLVMEATNVLASAAAKGNQKAQAAFEKFIAADSKHNE
jgi:hypothetical protein